MSVQYAIFYSDVIVGWLLQLAVSCACYNASADKLVMLACGLIGVFGEKYACMTSPVKSLLLASSLF